MTGERDTPSVWRLLAYGATTVLAFVLDHLEAIVFVVLVVLVAALFIPRHNMMGVIVCGAVAGGVAIGRLSR